MKQHPSRIDGRRVQIEVEGGSEEESMAKVPQLQLSVLPVSSMASSSSRLPPPWFCDMWGWICNLPPILQWKSDSMSIPLFTTESDQPSLKLTVTKVPPGSKPKAVLSLVAQFRLPISLWTSSSFHMRSKEETTFQLFQETVNAVLRYGPRRNVSFRTFSSKFDDDNSGETFNFTFLTLVFLVCVYEAPADQLRSNWLENLRVKLTDSRSREASKVLARSLGPNLEEKWMRSINLAITNYIIDLKSSSSSSSSDCFKVPSPLFSYCVSVAGLWKVQLYCPVIAMGVESSSHVIQDERLMFSLQYQQLEGVIQFSYDVLVQEKWIEVVLNVDNIRLDVISLLSKALMAERGLGSQEKHFPSRVSLHLTPKHQSTVISVSVAKSSNNPTQEIGIEKTLEGGFDPPNPSLGFKISATETVTMTMRPWKFEQSVHGSTANLNWSLHDSADGKDVSSSKPSRLQLIQHRGWFRDRNSNAYRPFTKEGGVVFAGDEYGDSVRWKLGILGKKRMEWEIRGWIWLTYWPNKSRSFSTETRRLEFRDVVEIPFA